MSLKNKKLLKLSKKKVIIIVVILLTTGGLFFYLLNNRTSNSAVSNPPVAQIEENDEIDLSPATNEDIARAEENKERITEKIEKENKQPQNPEISNTKPTITYAGQYGDVIEVGGYIDVFEDGGKCIAIFTKENLSITKDVNSVKGAQSVDCPVITAPVEEFAIKGQWDVVLKYKSVNYSGSSDKRTFEVNE